MPASTAAIIPHHILMHLNYSMPAHLQMQEEKEHEDGEYGLPATISYGEKHDSYPHHYYKNYDDYERKDVSCAKHITGVSAA